jgi:replication-associated recombination protein RarA
LPIRAEEGMVAMMREDDLRETLDRAADEIAQIQSNPRAWLSWLVYLLERLEGEATRSGSANKDSFLEMLSALQDTVRNRSRTGGW